MLHDREKLTPDLKRIFSVTSEAVLHLIPGSGRRCARSGIPATQRLEYICCGSRRRDLFIQADSRHLA
jgi:hypothetical protein